jgi:1-acyl-sn-glycerol-3-phosphate acyltransferase
MSEPSTQYRTTPPRTTSPKQGPWPTAAQAPETPRDADRSPVATAPKSAPALPSHLLRGVERIAAPALDAINRHVALKALTKPLWRYIGKNVVTTFSGNLYEVHGANHIRHLDAPAGIVLVANHRSFFDLFVTAAAIIDNAPHLTERMIFPVRKNYFYDTAPGLLLNLTLTSGSMWPPIFRDERKGVLNPMAMAQIGDVMRRGTLVGIHPEGRRGVGDDPYAFGSIKVGVGQLLNGAHPDVLVLPAFVLGAENDVFKLVRRNGRPAGKRGEPVRIRFGAPMRAGDLVDAAGGDEQAIADATMVPVAALGAIDRAERAVNPTVA